MKVKELQAKAVEEIVSEAEEHAIELIKESRKNIASCKRTLRALEKKHEKLLETELEDLDDTLGDY